MLVCYDEFNIGNGWYLTGWCPQFESGAVLVPRVGDPLLLGRDEKIARAIDGAVHESRQDDWRSNPVKVKKVRLAIKAVLKDDALTDQILELVKNQRDY